MFPLSGNLQNDLGECFHFLVFDTILLWIFITKYAHENMIIIPCPDSAGARKVRERFAKGRRKGSFSGTTILNNHHMCVYIYNYNIYIYTYIYNIIYIYMNPFEDPYHYGTMADPRPKQFLPLRLCEFFRLWRHQRTCGAGSHGHQGGEERTPVCCSSFCRGKRPDEPSCGFVWKWLVPLNPMVLLIIIPMKNGYNWEYTLFSDEPMWT